jgi:hypothetical protein
MKKEYFLLLIGCIVAIVFRFWLINISPQPFAFDQYEYYKFALQILDRGIFADSARLYGYPLLLAIIYKVFGLGNIQAVFVFQAMVDGLTALLIYEWAKLLFRQKSIPWIAFVLYIFNPYTSAYVGVVLSEVTGIFFTALFMYLFTLFWLKKKLVVFLLFSFVAGFLPQIRPAFLYFSGGLFVIGLCSYWKKRGVIIGILLFILPFLYVLWGNVVYFKEWKATNVDHIVERELFISVMVPNQAPYHMKSGYDVYPKEVMKLYQEYSVLPQSKQERAEMGNKYLTQATEIIKNDPWLFIRERLGKMFFVWEKHFLFYYQEIPNRPRDILVYWGNILLLVFGAMGLIKWSIERYKKNRKKMVLPGVYAFLIVYISVIHSVSLAEERYSLPGYPLLFLFAAYSFVLLWKTVKTKTC